MKISKKSQIHAERIARAYNERFEGDSGPFARMDANDTIALSEALEDAKARTYEDVYPALQARTFFNVDNSVDAGADVFSVERTDFRGEAAVISDDGNADDLPRVQVNASKELRSILSMGDSFAYTVHQLRAAAFLGKPLSNRLALAARRVYERKFDEIAAFGFGDSRISTGLVNDPNVDIKTVITGTWGTATAAQILADANKLVKELNVDSKETYSADSILLPTEAYHIMSQTYKSVDSDTTLLQAFLAANPGIQRVASWRALTGAGAGSTNRMIAYMQSPEVAEIIEPQAFEMLPPQARNLAFVVNCHGRTAGGAAFSPLGMAYMDGI